MEPVADSELAIASPVTAYREFAPHPRLRPYVRALFSFIPVSDVAPKHGRLTRQTLFIARDSFCSPLFAAGSASVVIHLGRKCIRGSWSEDDKPRAALLGPVTRATPSDAIERPAMIGAYFHAARVHRFFRVPTSEMTDRTLALEDVCGMMAASLVDELVHVDETARIERLEAELCHRLDFVHAEPRTCLNVAGLTDWISARGGRLRIESVAQAAGVSRQYLTRVFRDAVGVSPKTFGRLARFQAALARTSGTRESDWARVALELGYADQSHMIAEFREFTSLTPRQLASGAWFHPFIGAAAAKLT